MNGQGFEQQKHRFALLLSRFNAESFIRILNGFKALVGLFQFLHFEVCEELRLALLLQLSPQLLPNLKYVICVNVPFILTKVFLILILGSDSTLNPPPHPSPRDSN